jgi:prepilin-type N-terminal cleavage/methylation domain-containing protein
MKRQAGFTLLEVLVSVALMLVIMGTTLQMLTDAIHANEGVTLLADTQENLRAAMNYLVHDIVLAGSGIPQGGITIPNNATLGNPNPAVASNVIRPGPVGALPTFPVIYQLIPAITAGAAQGPPATTPDPNNQGATLAGAPTDFITIIYADTTLVDANNHTLNEFPVYLAPGGGPAGCAGANSAPAGNITATGNQITFDATCITINNGNTGINPGDLLMLQNALGTTLQTVTGVAGQVVTCAAADPFALNGTGKPSGTMLNIQNGIASPGGPYPPTTATRIWMITYYLSISAPASPLRPMLMRQVNFNPSQPVGEVLEDLGITYDINGGPTNTEFVDPTWSPNLIRKVNLSLAARSETAYSKTNDFFRNNLQTQVSVRSLAFFNQFN